MHRCSWCPLGGVEGIESSTEAPSVKVCMMVWYRYKVCYWVLVHEALGTHTLPCACGMPLTVPLEVRLLSPTTALPNRRRLVLWCHGARRDNFTNFDHVCRVWRSVTREEGIFNAMHVYVQAEQMWLYMIEIT